MTMVSPPVPPPALTEAEREELQEELIKVRRGGPEIGGQQGLQPEKRPLCVCVCVQVEDEIQTLSQVLAAKEKQLADIKRKLGITPLNELKQNISRTWQDVTTSTA